MLVGPSGCGKTTTPQDGQPAHRADVAAGSCSTASTRRRATSPSSAAASATSSSRRASSRTRRSRRTSPRCRACSAGRRPRRRRAPRSCSRWSASSPRRYAGRYPAQLSGGERQRVGRGPGAGRRPADHAHGRAVRRGGPDRPRAAPERVPAPPGAARQDDPVRDPRHRRGDQDGRPRGGLRGRRGRRPVRAAGGDPGQPRLGLRGPVRGRRPRPQAAQPVPGRRPAAGAGRHRAGGPDGAIARRVAHEQPFEHVLLVDAEQRPDRLGPPRPADCRTGLGGRRSSPRPRSSTGGRPSRTRFSMLLDADVQAGLVVDRTGAVRGHDRRSRTSRA